MVHSRQSTHFEASQSMTPVAPFLPSAPAGQTVAHLGSAHWRHSASSNSPGRGGSMLAPPLRTIWINERVVSVESNLTLAHAVMHLPQPSHLAGSKAMVE